MCDLATLDAATHADEPELSDLLELYQFELRTIFELARGPEVLTERRPVTPRADDRAQLGVAAVELLGQARVGVRLGSGEPPLELVVLGEHALDCVEHRPGPFGGVRKQCWK